MRWQNFLGGGIQGMNQPALGMAGQLGSSLAGRTMGSPHAMGGFAGGLLGGPAGAMAGALGSRRKRTVNRVHSEIPISSYDPNFQMNVGKNQAYQAGYRPENAGRMDHPIYGTGPGGAQDPMASAIKRLRVQSKGSM